MARIVKTPDERRRELIACAQKLFYSKGYESTSVRDMVNKVGVEDSAQIVLAIIETFSETFTELVLHAENYDNPVALARRKLVAMQTAIERVLGASQGSLPIVDMQTLDAWFED